MPRSRSLAAIALSAMVALAFALGSSAQAGLVTNVTVDITPEAGGLYLYNYTVSNLPTSTTNVGEFDLSLTLLPYVGIVTPTGATISSITSPTGFINAYTSGDPTIAFQSTASGTDIAPGASGQFSFVSTFAPVQVSDKLVSFDTGESVSGSTFAPATVPEPSSLVIAGLGVVGLVGCRLRRRRGSVG